MDDHAALKDALEESTLLINATSVGMVPDVTGTVIPDKTLFHPELTVADVVYEPRETRLLREAREAGCPTFNGMYMLLHQGVKAFHIWTGLDMPVEIVREHILNNPSLLIHDPHINSLWEISVFFSEEIDSALIYGIRAHSDPQRNIRFS